MFLKPDPDWKQYASPPLTLEDFTSLDASLAVRRFLVDEFLSNRQKDAEIRKSPDNTRSLIHLATVAGKMLFDKQAIVVAAESDVVLLFDNPDGMAHNVVIIKPGSIDKVGRAADAMAKTSDGYEKNFIPDIPEVLFATPLINAGDKYRLEFKAPSQPGDYSFICTFPGHWQSMQSLIKVVEPHHKGD